MFRRLFGLLALSAACLAAVPAPLHATPDVPMCVAEDPYVSTAPIHLVRWRMPMCGPFVSAVPIAATSVSRDRAIAAYRRASEEIAAARYDAARLELDLAHRGLARIRDRVALQSGRLELLRQRPARAIPFFSEAMQSPHDSVRVQASYGRVFALLRTDDPASTGALEELLATYPQLPKRAELLFEHAQSLVRQRREEDALAVLHALIVHHPGSPAAKRAETELTRYAALGYPVPLMTEADRVRRARELVTNGPLEEAKRAIQTLLQSELNGEHQAEVHYLAGRLARFEGRWRTAESYMRTAQSLPIDDVEAARRIEIRASDMAETANARDAEQARRRLSELRAGRETVSIPSAQLVEIVELASAASLQQEVDEALSVLAARKRLSSRILFEAAMAASGSGTDQQIAALLDRIARRPYSKLRTAALYHLGRLHERGWRPHDAELFFSKAKADAESSGDAYYALWADNALRRINSAEPREGREGFASEGQPPLPSPPPARAEDFADQLEPIAELHADGYPWLGRAVDLLRVGEREAATEELFETYLQWRHAQGRPVARAGLDCVARADGRIDPAIASDVRAARLELSEEERATISTVAAALGDAGTAGGLAGPDFIESLPRAYEWLVIPAANRHGLDPNLLLAVMRVESAFQKHIVSYAGAVGLMQIMPRTGQLIAHTLGRDDFTPADLLDPRLNLEFAAWYLTSLLHRFDGRLPLAIAAYNGGPHNVRRWIQESSEDAPLDVLLERIPFAQTHRYVRKVLMHYRAYREQRDLPMPLLSVTLPEQRVDPLAF